MSVQGKEKFQSTAMKISVNDTQVVTKNVWISRIIIQEKPPIKNQCWLRNTTSHVVRILLSQQKLNCQLNSLGAGDTPVQTFYPERERRRESRGFLNEIPINRLTLRASSTYTVPFSSCLWLHHNIFPSPLPDNQTLFSH